MTLYQRRDLTQSHCVSRVKLQRARRCGSRVGTLSALGEPVRELDGC